MIHVWATPVLSYPMHDKPSKVGVAFVPMIARFDDHDDYIKLEPQRLDVNPSSHKSLSVSYGPRPAPCGLSNKAGVGS